MIRIIRTGLEIKRDMEKQHVGAYDPGGDSHELPKLGDRDRGRDV